MPKQQLQQHTHFHLCAFKFIHKLIVSVNFKF